MKKLIVIIMIIVGCVCDMYSQNADSVIHNISGFVQYDVNKWTIRDNSLQKMLNDSIRPMIDSQRFIFNRLTISGAASPEGSYQNNRMLSINRYKTATDTIVSYIGRPNYIEYSFVPEDYDYLLVLMKNNNDIYYKRVYDIVSSTNDLYLIKQKLKQQSVLWNYLYREYFPALRNARYNIELREIVTKRDTVIESRIDTIRDTVYVPVLVLIDKPTPKRVPMLSMRTNLLYDVFYMPEYGFAPCWNLTAEYYPLRGHYTYNFGFVCPYYHKWYQNKFFQIEDLNFEVRRYFKHNDNSYYSGYYIGLQADILRYGIGFDKERGWEGEAAALGLTFGYVKNIGSGWKIHMHCGVSGLYTRYDPYVYGNPYTRDESTGLYYYKYYGEKNDFKTRRYDKFLVVPVNIGVSLSRDILYHHKKHRLRE